MTNEQRRAFDNLVLLCPNDHTLIDDLEPDEWDPERRVHHHQVGAWHRGQHAALGHLAHARSATWP